MKMIGNLTAKFREAEAAAFEDGQLEIVQNMIDAGEPTEKIHRYPPSVSCRKIDDLRAQLEQSEVLPSSILSTAPGLLREIFSSCGSCPKQETGTDISASCHCAIHKSSRIISMRLGVHTW